MPGSSPNNREVDIVIEGTFDRDPVITSVAVIEHGRSASVPWVEQRIRKNQYLPTSRLVLVSQWFSHQPQE